MALTLDSWLPVLRPHLPKDLVSDQAFARIYNLACHLPGDVMGVFEIRSALSVNLVDFSIRLNRVGQALQLADQLPVPHLRRLCTSGLKALGFPELFSALWLEFDLDSSAPSSMDGARLPIPVICARFSRAPEASWLLTRLLPALHGRSLPSTQQRLLAYCLERLPKDWRVLYAFSLLSRPGNAVRLELFGHSVESLHTYVRQVISEDAASRLEQRAHLYQGCDHYHLSFDIEETEISSRIGVEYAYGSLPYHEPRWTELLDRLVEADLCTPEKRRAALAWPGYDTIWTAASTWPKGARGYCVRGLSHLKLVWNGGEGLESKIYLVFENKS